MHRWHRVILPTVLLLVGHANVFACTLLDVTRETLAVNPDLLSSQANRQARYNEIRQAEAGYYPHIGFRAAGGRENSSNPNTVAVGNDSITLNRTEMGLTARQYVFDGWGVPSLVKENKYTSKVADYQYCDTRDTVITNVADAYLNILRQRELVEIATITVAAHQDIHLKMQKRYTAGAGDRTDVALAEARLARAQLQLVNGEAQLQQAITQYSAVTGKVPPRDMQMPVRPAKFLPRTLFSGLSASMTRNPNILASLAAIVASDAHVGGAMSHFFPNVDLEFDAENNQNLDGVHGFYRNVRGMAVLNYNLYSGGADQAAFAVAKAQRLKAIRDAEKAKRDVTVRIRNAWVALNANRALVQYSQDSVKSNLMVVSDYKKQFAIGERQLFNLLDAENDLFNSQVVSVNARYDYASAYYHVLQAIGNVCPAMLV